MKHSYRLCFFALIFATTTSLKTMAQREVPVPVPPYSWGESERYLYYMNCHGGSQFEKELIYAWGDTETIGGKEYHIVYDRCGGVDRPVATRTIHIRREGRLLLVRLDEYKAFMHDRTGRDMSDFDSRCQYRLTADGEMVLYDFDMQVGDRFRTVEGMADVVVTKRGKAIRSPLTSQDSLDLIYLSNGAVLLDGVGLEEYEYNQCKGGDFFDYLCLTGAYESRLFLVQDGLNHVYENYLDGSDPSGIFAVSTGMTPLWFQGCCHDLLGRRLSSPPAKGVYIQDGRKVVR